MAVVGEKKGPTVIAAPVCPPGIQTYTIAPAEVAVIVVVFISPVQRVVNVEVTDTVGVTPEVDTFTVSFLLHPAVLIPVTMYEVVTVGLAVGLAKVVLFKPAPGLHK